MSWRFLVDEDLPRSTAVALRQAGHTAEDVRDIGLRGHTDQAVFEYAQSVGAILVTADKGFANVLRFPPGSHAGIILVRVPNELPTREVNQELLRAPNGPERRGLERSPRHCGSGACSGPPRAFQVSREKRLTSASPLPRRWTGQFAHAVALAPGADTLPVRAILPLPLVAAAHAAEPVLRRHLALPHGTSASTRIVCAISSGVTLARMRSISRTT